MDQIVVNGIQAAMLEALIDTGALLETPVLALFQNDLEPTVNTVLANITAATFDGYATEAITWGTPSLSADGHWEVIGTAGEFRPTGSVTPNLIYGAYVLGAGGVLFSVGRLDEPPESMAATSNSMLLTVRLRVSPLGVPTVVIT